MAKQQRREESTTFVLDLDLSIDENNLVEEWRGQATMMLEYGIYLADAQQEEDEARNAMAAVDADLDNDIRDRPGRYGLDKITEAAIARAVAAQDGHKRAERVLLQARYKARVLRAAVDAIGHRKSALQGMTELFLKQWYADPKAPSQPPELREAARSGPPAMVPVRRKVRRRV